MHRIFYDWGGLNTALFHLINNAPGLFDSPVMILAALIAENRMFPVWFAFACLCAFHSIKSSSSFYEKIERKRKWKLVLSIMVVAAMLDVLAMRLLKNSFQYPRPFIALAAGSFRILPEIRNSVTPFSGFPSGHSAFAMLIYASVRPVLNPYGRIFGGTLVAWVALSRIALGVHFPTDVAAGLIISFAVVYMTRVLLSRLSGWFGHEQYLTDDQR